MKLDGDPFPANQKPLQKPFNRARDAAGLPSWATPHVMRHTWATWFYAQTKDVLRLKQEGGWKSDQWERYTKIAPPRIGADAFDRGWDFSEVGDFWGSENKKQYKTIP